MTLSVGYILNNHNEFSFFIDFGSDYGYIFIKSFTF